MKTAHHRASPTALPGLSSPSTFGPGPWSSAPEPPAPVADERYRGRTKRDAGLDGWLLDRLFGGR